MGHYPFDLPRPLLPMIVFFLSFILFYSLVMMGLLSKWKIGPDTEKVAIPDFTLIVPFRNEEENFVKTLDTLRNLKVAEIIFCDDHSEDRSAEIVAHYIRQFDLPHWKLITNSGLGKKAAITSAVIWSRHDIIMTTDADCFLTNKGINHLVSFFRHPSIQMVCGPVTVMPGDSFLEKYQVAEWASISLVTNYFFKIKKPLMCSAANMAYRKDAFLSVDGYRHNEFVSSGDDEYLLKKIAKHFGPASIMYTCHPDAVVKTIATADFKTYISQRARWAGKWKAHRQAEHAGTALLFFVIALIQVSSVGLLGGSLINIVCFFVFWIAKIAVDQLVLGKVMEVYHKKQSILTMVSNSVFHPLSVILIGIFSIFVKNTWKGRVVLTKA